MKHRFLSIAAAAMLLVGCRHAVPPPPTSMPRLESLDTVAGTVFVPAMNFPLSDSCNVVYAPTLLYAWSDLTDQLPSPLTLPGERYLQLFAHAGNYKDALEKGEYTTTTLTRGNTVSLTASFAMRLPFTSPMDTSIMLFRGQRVKAFGMPGRHDEKIAGQITILYYENDDRFIISITPKNDNDLIILVKGFGGATFAALTESVSAAISSFAQRDTITDEMWKHELRHDDDVCIPAMGFNYTCHYKTFEGQHFSAGETSYQIKTAEQRNAFVLNESGARVESVAMLEVTAAAAPVPGTVEKPRNKHLWLDTSFVLMLKKKNTTNPYFMVAVNNTGIMEKR